MNSTYDFWKLLNSYDVVVPVIQRDYAQGRKGKEYLRKVFLTEIKNYLCNNVTASLDFVYGNVVGKSFFPLDGQQRLTSLWLIYWYVSFRAGKLESDCKTLARFTYETRPSSREFCTKLCEKMGRAKYDEVTGYGGIVEYIKSQTWFYTSWLQDPTVSAMLRTLGGDGDQAIDSNIETIFDACDYNLLRDRLVNNPLISFELMIIGSEKLPISDDLYIKMNARGKALSDFENFKADLVAWIQSSDNPDKEEFEKPKDKISYKQYYPSKIDNEWTDVFWKSARAKMQERFDGRIDKIYFSFINRFVLNKICIAPILTPVEYAQSKEDSLHKTEKLAFDRLLGAGLRGSSADDSLVTYEGFEIYKKYVNAQSLAEIDYILETVSEPAVMKAVGTALDIKDADKDEEENSSIANGYTFIPQYSLDQEPTLLSTSQKERVYFHAVCKFILNSRSLGRFDEVLFFRWMRVVKNLTENAAIDNIPAMVTCLRLINKLADKMMKNNDIYICLKNYNEPFSNSRLECQLKEEKEKAEKILSDYEWENKIIEAENFSFFNGTIRFLYRNVWAVDWGNFDERFKTAQKLFANYVPVSTIEKMLRQFNGFDDIKDKYLFTSVGYHARHKCWKKDILCSDTDDVLSKVNFLLVSGVEPSHDKNYQEFLDSGLIEKVVGKEENYKYRYHWHGYWAVHKDYSQTEGVYVSLERKTKNLAFKEFADKGTILVCETGSNFFLNGYYWGIRVEFEYKNVKYRWYEAYDNGKRIDKIHKVVNGKESAKGFVWDECGDLLCGIDSFEDWG